MASKAETPGQLKQRHKLELRALQNEVKAFQKKAKKDRLSKQETEARVQQMEAELKARHAAELAVVEDDAEEEAAVAAVEEAPAAPQAKAGPSKAQRRREKQKQQERERQERIEEANKHTVSERQIEADIIQSKLARHGLTIKDIPSDGHCMYHAVADQLQRHGASLPNAEEPAFQSLRRITGQYMRAHRDDFLPFMALDEDSGKSLSELYEEYCDRVVSTADWGGQLELRALACALERPIHVFAAEGDEITMGAEFDKEPLQLTYHLHYYTLGEHFNSVAAQS